MERHAEGLTRSLVVCVVLNTDRRVDTLECLASIARSDYSNLHTIVLDCQSSDGSAEAVRSAFPDVQVIELSENRGYAGNNNVGIRAALDTGARWVFILNEDTVLDSTCVSKLLEAADVDSHIGVVGPTVYHHDEPHLIQSAGGGLSRRWEGFHLDVNQRFVGQPAEARDVQWISGCGILVRREVIEAVGGLDERFFIYWEETEWCVRAAKAGWRIVHVPDAQLWHKGVQRDYRPRPSVTYYSTRNRLLMLAIHEAPLSAWLVAWAQIARTLASWTLKPRWRHKRDHRNAMWRAVSDFLAQRWGRMPERAQR